MSAPRLVLAALVATAVLVPAGRALAADPAIPRHPDDLRYPALAWQPPRAEPYRVTLANGAVAYLVPDRTLPLVSVRVAMRIGQDLDPAGHEGTAAMAMFLMTRSGTPTRTAKQLEDRLAFLGADLGSGLGGAESGASINVLTKDLDEGMTILGECMRSPAWEPERLQLRREQVLLELKQRNDRSSFIEDREWSILQRGENHWVNRFPTAASVSAITAADLAAFHKRYVGPKNFVIAVSGDFDRADMVKRLERWLANWPTPGERPGPPAAPTVPPSPGWYLVDKDVNQARVSVGVQSIDRYDPDYQAARIMNDILGGGSMTSRLGRRIRSDEGLSYQVSSYFDGGTYYPDPWRLVFQSKVRSTAFALQIALEEIGRMRDSTITTEELEVSKNKFIESLPASFETADAIAGAFANEEITGRYARDPAYFTELRDRLRKVTIEDVRRVARRVLDPSKQVVIVVGNATDILAGDGKHPVTLARLAGGEPKRLPLRDPLTMKPLPTP